MTDKTTELLERLRNGSNRRSVTDGTRGHQNGINATAAGSSESGNTGTNADGSSTDSTIGIDGDPFGSRGADFSSDVAGSGPAGTSSTEYDIYRAEPEEAARPVGLMFLDTPPLPPPIPPVSARRNRKNEQANTQSDNAKPGIVNTVLRKTAGTEDAGRSIPKDNRVFTDTESDKLREQIERTLIGISEVADAMRGAYLRGHPKNTVFALDDKELQEFTDWFIRRGKRSVKMARRIRATTDLYDAYAIPMVIMIPRFRTLLEEIRTQGVTIRGR